MKFIDKEFSRFVAIGAVNTLLTYFFYIILLVFVSYQISYSITYIFGIYLSYYLNTRFVFNQKASITKAVQYPLVYLAQYLLGLLLLYILVEIMEINKLIAPILSIIVTIPVVFLLSRIIIKGKLNPKDSS